MKRIRRPWRKFYAAIAELLVYSPTGFWAFHADVSDWIGALRRSQVATKVSNPSARLLMVEQERGLYALMREMHISELQATARPEAMTNEQLMQAFPESKYCVVADRTGQWKVEEVKPCR